MKQYIKTEQFTQHLFDDEKLAGKAATVIDAILAARSPRLSEIARHMPGTVTANAKALQRLLPQIDPEALLGRLFQPAAEYVIGDPTEIARPQAKKSEYVGTLKDGETPGFWLLLLATPCRGRALPCGFITYSSKTISQQATSRNLEHWRAFEALKAQLGERPLVLDREFSYQELLEYLQAAGIHFVIRLNLGSKPPIFLNQRGREVELKLRLGEKVLYYRLLYRRQVPVNVIGIWRKGHARPLWVMSDLEPEQALAIYFQRMKVEETFRDLKSLLGLHKIMNKQQRHMEQVVALVLLAFCVGLLVGEALRDHLFPDPPATGDPPSPAPHSRAWLCYSGLFLVLKYKPPLALPVLRALAHHALVAFFTAISPPVPIHV